MQTPIHEQAMDSCRDHLHPCRQDRDISSSLLAG